MTSDVRTVMVHRDDNITFNVFANCLTNFHSSLFSSYLHRSLFKSEVTILIASLYLSANLSIS